MVCYRRFGAKPGASNRGFTKASRKFALHVPAFLFSSNAAVAVLPSSSTLINRNERCNKQVSFRVCLFHFWRAYVIVRYRVNSALLLYLFGGITVIMVCKYLVAVYANVSFHWIAFS